MRKLLLFVQSLTRSYLAASWLIALVLLSVVVPRASAQEADVGGDEVESLYSKEEKAPEASADLPDKAAATSAPKDMSDLQTLAPFEDIAVIEKRYLPKSQRFEIFAGLGSTLNDAFFNDFMVSGRLAYYFRERYAAELLATFVNTSNAKVTNDLQARQVNTTSLVTPKSYYGVDFKWSPIYGKMTWINKKIVHFDMYFSAGPGMTGTDNGSEPTLHIGTGQLFSLNKSVGLRWDLGWNFYQATSTAAVAGATGSRSTYNSLFFLLGVSLFFPEANYR
jgi:outer membrane beta-barrel protein